MVDLDTKSLMAVVMAAKWQEYYNAALTEEESKALSAELERVKLLLPATAGQRHEAELAAFIAGYKHGVELALSLGGLNGEDLDETAKALAEIEEDFKRNSAQG